MVGRLPGVRVTGEQKILAALRTGPKTASELYSLGCIAHSRVAALRAQGHRITCTRVPGDAGARSYVYELLEPLGGAHANPLPACASPSGPRDSSALRDNGPGPLLIEGQLSLTEAFS